MSGLSLAWPRGVVSKPIRLADRATGTPRTATLVRTGPRRLSPEARLDFANSMIKIWWDQWKPAMAGFIKPQNDRGWDWGGLWESRERLNSPPVECVVLAVADKVHGIMISGPLKETNIGPRGRRLLYLAYMATAPWNRPGFSPPSGSYPKAIRGVGTELIKQAILMSKEYGCGGRLGFRALGDSWRFYKKIGMQRLGKKVKDDEFSAHAWYEFSDAGVREFLKEHPP